MKSKRPQTSIQMYYLFVLSVSIYLHLRRLWDAFTCCIHLWLRVSCAVFWPSHEFPFQTVSTIREAELLGHLCPSQPSEIVRSIKESLTWVQPSIMKIKQAERTIIFVFSVFRCALQPSPPFNLSFYTCQLSITLMLITVGRHRGKNKSCAWLFHFVLWF